MTILGIDEAGRGPVIGPLVVAGVEIEKKDEARLKALGVKDSKLLSPARRETLAAEIYKIAKSVETVVVPAYQIDQMRLIMSLNQIELNAFVKIINSLDSSEAYIDLPENGNTFEARLRTKLTNKEIKIIAEHKADAKYPVVSAASIIAKTERDHAIEDLKKDVGADFGSGYPADERTINFLKNFLKEHNEFPPYVRKSWMTIQNLLGKKKQKDLLDY